MQLAVAAATSDVHGLEVTVERASGRVAWTSASPTSKRGLPTRTARPHGRPRHRDRAGARPGGYAVVSTENLSSWHNVGALVLRWQQFSLTNVSARRMGLGNPLAVHRGEAWEYPSSWQHRRVFAYRGLVELFEAHGLAVETVRGSGYYPLPRRVAEWDPRHAAFLSLRARKPA